MADMALLEELMVALLDDIIIDELILLDDIIIDELILLELIIVDIVDMGAIPAVTVIVIVHGAVETTFMTGAINMHVESGGAAIIEEDIIICALASDAAARAVAVWVILTILEGRDVKKIVCNERHSQNARWNEGKDQVQLLGERATSSQRCEN